MNIMIVWADLVDSYLVGVKPLRSGPSMVHATYVREKPLSGFSTTGYMWTSFL